MKVCCHVYKSNTVVSVFSDKVNPDDVTGSEVRGAVLEQIDELSDDELLEAFDYQRTWNTGAFYAGNKMDKEVSDE
jgi:hypothetical protein